MRTLLVFLLLAVGSGPFFSASAQFCQPCDIELPLMIEGDLNCLEENEPDPEGVCTTNREIFVRGCPTSERCEDPSDCPQSNSRCSQATCVAGRCGFRDLNVTAGDDVSGCTGLSTECAAFACDAGVCLRSVNVNASCGASAGGTAGVCNDDGNCECELVPIVSVNTSACTTEELQDECTFLRVFLSDTQTKGKFGAGGLSGGDAICQADADASGLGGTWQAYLSDSNTGALARLIAQLTVAEQALPYKLLTGEQVVNTAADVIPCPFLGADCLDSAIDTTSTGATIGASFVWTGTLNTGLSGGAGDGNHCADWTFESGALGGVCGRSTDVNSDWVFFLSGKSISCSLLLRLYCFEVEREDVRALTRCCRTDVCTEGSGCETTFTCIP